MARGAARKKSPTAGEETPERGHSTRELLLLAAERLFAEEGIGSVSMRRINNEANQKNVSALHYHFGSREAIVEAIFEYRMTHNNQRRNAMLLEIERDGLHNDLHSLVRVAIWPLAETLMNAAQPNYFARFNAECHRVPYLDTWNHIRHKARRSIAQVYVMIVRCIGDELPRPIVHTRTVMALRHAVYVLADLDRVIEQRHPDMRDEMVLFHTNELIDIITADLRAAMSPATRRAYETLTKKPGHPRGVLLGPDGLQVHHLAAVEKKARKPSVE